jgi:hypothetical protein
VVAEEKKKKKKKKKRGVVFFAFATLRLSSTRTHRFSLRVCGVSSPRFCVCFLFLCGLLKRPVRCGKRKVVSGRERAKHHVGWWSSLRV